MKCPKCGFTNLDYADFCKRCHHDLIETRMLLGIIPVKPGQISFLSPPPSPITESRENQTLPPPISTPSPSPENDISIDFTEPPEEPAQPTSIDLSQIDFSDLGSELTAELKEPESKSEDMPVASTGIDLSEFDLSNLELESSIPGEPQAANDSPVPPAETNEISLEGLLEDNELSLQLEEMLHPEEGLKQDSDKPGENNRLAPTSSDHGGPVGSQGKNDD